jgi:hypothetical protein
MANRLLLAGSTAARSSVFGLVRILRCLAIRELGTEWLTGMSLIV